MRSYPVPKSVRLSLDGTGPITSAVTASGTLTTDQLERAIWSRNEGLATWAQTVLGNERRQTLDKLLGSTMELPLGVLDRDSIEEDIVTGLLDSQGRLFTKDGWVITEDDYKTLVLDEDSVAFVASALSEGADGVVLRMWFPLAVIGAAGEPAPPTDDGSVTLAIVDDLDRTAVLDVLRVMPGPVVERRNDGQWVEDPGWATILRSPKPPPVVELGLDIEQSVLDQVDESTKGEEFKAVNVATALTSSAWSGEIMRHADEAGVLFAVVAAKGAGNVTHPVATEKLREYWTRGKGALKIRWGTPGSWTRCHRHLSKYLGPRAAGYCTNLCQRLGGYKVACHVGD